MKPRPDQAELPVGEAVADPAPARAPGHLMRLLGSSADLTWATPQDCFDYLNFRPRL